MYKIIKLSNIILLTLFLSCFCLEDINWAEEMGMDQMCSDKKKGCSFVISPNNPFSPIIPTDIPTQAILLPYRYVYLKFSLPKNKQYKFYLSAYDFLSGETIISNGDCYLIDLSDKLNYEIQIYKTLTTDSYIQFLFLNLKKDFSLEVEFSFELDINLYFTDGKLNMENSLYMNSLESMKTYILEMEKQKKDQKRRLEQAREKAISIAKKLFDIDVTIKPLPKYTLINTGKAFIPPNFIVSIKIAAGLQYSKDNILYIGFKEVDVNGQTQLGVVTQRNGKTTSSFSDPYTFFDGKVEIDSDIRKLLKFFEKLVTKQILEPEFKEGPFTLIISVDFRNNILKYNFQFEQDVKYFTIAYEIEFEIQVNNPITGKQITVQQEVYSSKITADEIYKPKIKGLVFGVGFGALIFKAGQWLGENLENLYDLGLGLILG